MKPEREVLLISKLLKSPFVNKKNSSCKSEFEKYCKISNKNKEFRKFFQELVLIGIIEIFERKKVGKFGHEVNTYFINKGLLLKKLKGIKEYREIKSVVTSMDILD